MEYLVSIMRWMFCSLIELHSSTGERTFMDSKHQAEINPGLRVQE
jgi:hypothetical protein